MLQLEGVLRKLQPRAKLIRSEHGKVDAKAIMNTGLFNYEEASVSAGWMKELEKPAHLPETDEYGITSFVYERIAPFHPQRLMEWMEEWPEEVIRAKGMVWLATRSTMGQSLSQAGPSIQFGPSGYWVAALSEAEKQDVIRENPEILDQWDDRYGDRINKLVFIGIDMDHSALISGLDTCLLTDEEMQLDWSQFSDEFPNVPAEQLELAL